jgi:hypothetical protein
MPFIYLNYIYSTIFNILLIFISIYNAPYHPETGEIIKTTGKRGRPPKDPEKKGKRAGSAGENDYRALYDMKNREVESLKKELSKTAEERDRLSVQLSELKKVITVIRAQVSSVKDL